MLYASVSTLWLLVCLCSWPWPRQATWLPAVPGHGAYSFLSQFVGSPFSSPQAQGWPLGGTRHWAVFPFCFSSWAASTLMSSCPVPSAHSTCPHHVFTSGTHRYTNSSWVSNDWKGLGVTSPREQRKPRCESEPQGPRCLERAELLEVLHFSVLKFSWLCANLRHVPDLAPDLLGSVCES
jgi:hypothetical protein